MKMKTLALISLYIFVCFISPAYPQQQRQHHLNQHRLRTDRDRERNVNIRKFANVHPCEHSSCYPATGNLLIGRENRLTASSTCGLRRSERFCIVSHLEEKKCFLCDTREETRNDPLKNHRPGQMIYANKPGTRIPSWWQSENGKENVTIQLDLEAEFHFTHLIIVFATFRPAEMLIERSYDFGKTWHIYRYFSHNCPESFPGIPEDFRNITDIVCDSRYSSVEPSKNGEVIFRVLPPNMKVPDPYAPHVQNMLKMTNLRINFTKLHNLGDTLLDDRHEIQEKYYYAINNMIVRGSCSCYGHASRCLPLDPNDNAPANLDMVHGRCECTHNTKGLNCEQCEDFYNDLPWKPALGKQTNACKKCNCNNHADSCHFDEVVFDRSGKISGGVCDNCQHNTQGQHCEECMPFYYRDPLVDISSPYVCRPCDCNTDGSVDDGICDSISDQEPGQCHCKTNVHGRQCDTCKEGYWNLNPNNPDGCQNCTCNTLGTINNSGCNMFTGECSCKVNVAGQNCNECRPETYGLSEQPEGCTPCQCDVGGSLDNMCDVVTGQCRCRENMSGRRCESPIQNYFIPNLPITVQAESHGAKCSGYLNHNCSRYEQNKDYMLVPFGSEIEFTINDIPKTMTYDVQLKYMTQSPGQISDTFITIIRPESHEFQGEPGTCTPAEPQYEQRVPLHLPDNQRSVVAMRDVCLEKGKTYRVRLHFERLRSPQDENSVVHILVDSVNIIPGITPENHVFPNEEFGRDYFEKNCHYDSNDPYCSMLNEHIAKIIQNGSISCNCDPTGSLSKQCEKYGGSCSCKPNVIGRKCDMCAPGTYGFGPDGCKACDCNSIGSKDNNCDVLTGQCNCMPNTFGRECDQCQPGYWNFPNCMICQCNGHTNNCDALTGECLNCGDYTTGSNCNECLEGFYGDPSWESDIGCRPCRCPDTFASNHSHAIGCQLDRRNDNMQCLCQEGYTGQKCDECSDNYFGSPDIPGGSCSLCNCSDNINPRDYGNCDPKTGTCLKCLYETTGEHCEICQDGFYGNALEKDCRPCDCELLGTNSTIKYCDRYTGHCPCLPNVKGITCNECIENHWKIASGEGCEHCNCDPIGSLDEQCNAYDGQCVCKTGFGGRQCNQCQSDFWGDPNVECHRCDCDPYGSAETQCDRETGKCVCKQGIGGDKCNVCARGFIGQAPYCSACGECFDNWDIILTNLEEETQAVIKQAKEIKTIGATGAYTSDFNELDDKLNKIREILKNTTIGIKDLSELDERTKSLQQRLQNSHDNLAKTDELMGNMFSNLTLSKVTLEALRGQSQNISQKADALKENGIELQESNIEGALNLTKSAHDRVLGLTKLKEQVLGFASNTERQCKRIETLENKINSERDIIVKNEQSINDYHQQLNELKSAIPELNTQVCGAKPQIDDSCDDVCGGGGCGKCGGELSCTKGALTKTEQAFKVAKNAEEAIKNKKDLSFSLIRSLTQAKLNASEAFNNAKSAYDNAELYLNETKQLVDRGEKIAHELSDFKQNETDNPKEAKQLAEQILSFDLVNKQEDINTLSDKIKNVVNSLSNVDDILYKTQGDLDKVNNLKRLANETKTKANDILRIAEGVVLSLQEAHSSQEKAEKAIQEAKKSIALASKDLEETDVQTKEAEEPANITAANVEELMKKVQNLQKSNTQNEIDAKLIQDESSAVEELANKALTDSKGLKEEANVLNDDIGSRESSSKIAKERTASLLDRVSQLTVKTKNNLDELSKIKSTYRDNESLLDSLKAQLQNLKNQMGEHVSVIKSRSEGYRTCS